VAGQRWKDPVADAVFAGWEPPLRTWDFLTATDAEHELGIRANTVRVWANRRQIFSRGIDPWQRPLYDRSELLARVQRSRHADD